MGKRFLAAALALCMMFTFAACGESEEEKAEKERIKQEEAQKKADQETVDSLVETIEHIPEEVTLDDRENVEGIRNEVNGLTEDQLALMPADIMTKLEDAESQISVLEKKKAKKQKIRAKNRAAARKATAKIEAIPDNVTSKSESTINEARSAYDGLTDDQKSLVDEASLTKLTNAEATLKEIKEKEEKKAEEKKKKKEKKAEKSSKSNDDKYSIAKKYVGKKASSLTAKIGKPKKSKKNPNCATDGEEYIYYYDGFYVGVQSQTMDSPLIVLNVEKN